MVPALPRRFEQLVAEATREPWIFGCSLVAYQRAQYLDDQALAAQLGISPARLLQLKLCPRPRPDPYQIRLSRIADAFAVDLPTLAGVLAAGDLSRDTLPGSAGVRAA